MSTRPTADPERLPPEELAGRLRVLVGRLNHALGMPGRRRGATPTRLMALWTLEKMGPMRPGDLACRLSVTAASMSRLAEALEEQGWLVREPDPEDRRSHRLRINREGRRMLADLRRESTSGLAADVAALPSDEQELLARALPVLATLAEAQLEGSAARR